MLGYGWSCMQGLVFCQAPTTLSEHDNFTIAWLGLSIQTSADLF